jgi:5-methylcytosine-specific restriction endonuclease McrA
MDTLILNSSGVPISLLPLSTIPWQEAVRLIVLERVVVLHEYEDKFIHSQHETWKIPAVIMLKEYSNKKTQLRYSKANVYLRDEFKCQYCGIEVSKKNATLDHVLPLSHGGKSTWENSSTACSRCNSSKGNKKHILPRTVPYKPNYYELCEKRKKLRVDLRHPSWGDYLG